MEIKFDIINNIFYLIIYNENFCFSEFLNFWLKKDILLHTNCKQCTSYFNFFLESFEKITNKQPNKKILHNFDFLQKHNYTCIIIQVNH